MTMNTKTFALIVGLAAALLPSAMQGQQVCPGPAGATSCTIDDFSSGFYSKTLSTGTATDTQTGTMVGGTRVTELNVCVPSDPCNGNPFEQPNSYQIKKGNKAENTPNILIFNTGYDSDANLQWTYGEASTLNLDLSSYDRIRLYFNGADQVLNFNLIVFSNGPYNDIGCNIANPFGPQTAFTVDLPFANFVDGTNFDFGDLTGMTFEFGVSQGAGTGEDWGLTSIQAAYGVTGNPVICGSPAN